MAWVEDAQAVTVAKFAPLKPVFIATVPAAMLAIIMGTYRAEILLTPPSRKWLYSCSVRPMPPTPTPKMQPAR